MNGYPRDFAADDKHGLDWSFHPDQGAFFIGEASYQWLSTEAGRRASPRRLPDRVIFGAYYDTGNLDWQDGSGRTSSGLSNVYVILRQKVWEPNTASCFSDILRPASEETTLEAAYSFWVYDWLTVTADLQYIVDPSGDSSIENVWIPGVLLYVTF